MRERARVTIVCMLQMQCQAKLCIYVGIVVFRTELGIFSEL